jgi:murein DD-endopeptidase MepM/ murein hydrolase activator NlpD
MTTRKLVLCVLSIVGGVALSTAQDRPLISPIAGKSAIDVSSGYGMRVHPVLKIHRFHNGVDFDVPEGTPVRATAQGIVTQAGVKDGYGLVVRIKHGKGLETRYAHLSGLAIAKGAAVESGTVIGYSGKSGLASVPRLHYEVIKNGKYTDPKKYLPIYSGE